MRYNKGDIVRNVEIPKYEYEILSTAYESRIGDLYAVRRITPSSYEPIGEVLVIHESRLEPLWEDIVTFESDHDYRWVRPNGDTLPITSSTRYTLQRKKK